jgi:Holliday junction resolvase RusA-like endonuclease
MSRKSIEFNVIGTPAPQGSKTRMPNGAMVEGSSATGRLKHRTWRQAVALEAHHQRQLHEHCFTTPVCVTAVFRFALPKSRAANVRRAITEGVMVGWKGSKPDLDKLCRSIFDSLETSGLLAHDALVAQCIATKIEVGTGEWTGARITVTEL